MKLTRSQSSFVADKLMDSANVALAGLVFGQLISDNSQPLLVLLGILLYLWCWTVSVRLNKGVRQHA